MAQAIKNKDVRKNCIDVEKALMECLSEPERENILEVAEPVKSINLNKEVLKISSKYNAKKHQELIPINQVNEKVVFRNFMLKY